MSNIFQDILSLILQTYLLPVQAALCFFLKKWPIGFVSIPFLFIYLSVTQVTTLKEEVNSLQALLLQKQIRGGGGAAVDECGRNSNDNNVNNDEVIDLSS